MVAVLLHRFWFLRWHLHTKFDPRNIQALLEPLFLWVALTVTGKAFLWQHHSVFLFCELLQWRSRFSKVVLYNALLYLHSSRNTWPGVFRLRGTGPWVSPIVLVLGEQWWTWPAQPKGQSPWTLAWRGSAGARGRAVQGAEPRWKLCPAVGGQPTPPWRSRPISSWPASHGWWGSSAWNLRLGCPCCSNPSSGMEQLFLPALFNNWLQNREGLGFALASQGKPHCSLLGCKSTSSKAATATFKKKHI